MTKAERVDGQGREGDSGEPQASRGAGLSKLEKAADEWPRFSVWAGAYLDTMLSVHRLAVKRLEETEKKAMQFLSDGRYVANVVNGKVIVYGSQDGANHSKRLCGARFEHRL